MASADRDRLTEVARNHLRVAAGIRISPAVLLELEYLYEIKRLLLPASDIRLKLEKEIGLEVWRQSTSLQDKPLPEVVGLSHDRGGRVARQSRQVRSLVYVGPFHIPAARCLSRGGWRAGSHGSASCT